MRVVYWRELVHSTQLILLRKTQLLYYKYYTGSTQNINHLHAGKQAKVQSDQ